MPWFIKDNGVRFRIEDVTALAAPTIHTSLLDMYPEMAFWSVVGVEGMGRVALTASEKARFVVAHDAYLAELRKDADATEDRFTCTDGTSFRIRDIALLTPEKVRLGPVASVAWYVHIACNGCVVKYNIAPDDAKKLRDLLSPELCNE